MGKRQSCERGVGEEELRVGLRPASQNRAVTHAGGEPAAARVRAKPVSADARRKQRTSGLRRQKAIRSWPTPERKRMGM